MRLPTVLESRRVAASAVMVVVLVLSAAVAPPAASQPVATTNEAVASQHHTDSDFQTAAALTNTTIEGSGDTASVGLSGESRQVIDDFEDGDLSEYSITGDGPDGAPPTVTSSQSYSGSYSLELTAEGGSSNNAAIESSSGLNYYPEPGDSVDVYVKTDDASEGGQYFKFGKTSSHQITVGYQGNNGYIEINSPNDGVQTSTSLNADEWYRFHVEWASDGGVVFEVYDSTDSQVAAVSLASSDVTSGGYVGFKRWSGSGTVHSWFDYAYRKSTQPDAGTYLSGNHSVSQPTRAWANLTLNNASATVEWQGWTGSSWTVVNSSTYSTSGNKTLDVSGFERWRVNVSFTAESGTTTARLHDEGLLFDPDAPTVDNATASPDDGTFVTTDDVTLSINVSDADFATSQGDSLTVDWFVDGSKVDETTVSSNGTASTSVAVSGGGSHTWHAVVTDAYGESTTSDTFSFERPGTVRIHPVHQPRELLNDSDVTVTARLYSGDLVFNRSVSDGTLDLRGLPIDRDYILVLRANGYYRRSVLLESLLTQSDVYLLNDSRPALETEFVLDDRTGRFTGSDTETKLIIERALNITTDDELTWVTVAGDYIGAEGTFTTDLEENQRYRIRVVGNNNSRVLGTYTAARSGLVKLAVGEVQWTVDEPETIRASARFYNLTDDGEPPNGVVHFQYSDPNESTDSLRVVIHEHDNASNEIMNTTFTQGYGTLSLNKTITGSQMETTWVVDYRALDADGNVIREGTRLAGGQQYPLVNPLGAKWAPVALTGVFLFTATLFGGRLSSIGALVVTGVAASFWWLGWYEVSGGVVLFAGVVAVISAVGGGRR